MVLYALQRGMPRQVIGCWYAMFLTYHIVGWRHSIAVVDTKSSNASKSNFLQRYVRLKTLNDGPYVLYLCEEAKTHQLCCVRIVTLPTKEDAFKTMEFFKQMQQQHKHRNLLKLIDCVYEFINSEHIVHMILEYCPEGSLDELITKRLMIQTATKYIPESKILFYALQLVAAIEQYHTKLNTMHGLVSSQNIFLRENGAVIKLGDGGPSFTRILAQQATDDDQWAAPEVVKRKKAGTAADLFALGCVLLELMTMESRCVSKLVMHDEKKLHTEIQDFITKNQLRYRPELVQLAFDLTKPKPSTRPSLSTVKDLLTKLFEKHAAKSMVRQMSQILDNYDTMDKVMSKMEGENATTPTIADDGEDNTTVIERKNTWTEGYEEMATDADFSDEEDKKDEIVQQDTLEAKKAPQPAPIVIETKVKSPVPKLNIPTTQPQTQGPTIIAISEIAKPAVATPPAPPVGMVSEKKLEEIFNQERQARKDDIGKVLQRIESLENTIKSLVHKQMQLEQQQQELILARVAEASNAKKQQAIAAEPVQNIDLKIKLSKEGKQTSVKRMLVRTDMSFSDFTTKAGTLFKIDFNAAEMQYVDEENDCISITDDEEWKMALRIAHKSMNQALKVNLLI